MRVALGVTGGIAAYKAPELVRRLGGVLMYLVRGEGRSDELPDAFLAGERTAQGLAP